LPQYRPSPFHCSLRPRSHHPYHQLPSSHSSSPLVPPSPSPPSTFSISTSSILRLLQLPRKPYQMVTAPPSQLLQFLYSKGTRSSETCANLHIYFKSIESFKREKDEQFPSRWK